MENNLEFIIKSAVLVHYCGPGGDVVIPKGVWEIGWAAFANCRSLTSLSIPESITDIGAGAFTGCAGLADERGMVIVNDILFDYSGPDLDVTVPEGITAISGWDFRRNASVTIPESVNEIEEINQFDDDMEYSENLIIRAPAGSLRNCTPQSTASRWNPCQIN